MSKVVFKTLSDYNSLLTMLTKEISFSSLLAVNSGICSSQSSAQEFLWQWTLQTLHH